jgi:hypothetical protein
MTETDDDAVVRSLLANVTPRQAAQLLGKLERGHQAFWPTVRPLYGTPEWPPALDMSTELSDLSVAAMWATFQSGMRQPGESLEEFAARAERECAEPPAAVVAQAAAHHHDQDGHRYFTGMPRQEEDGTWRAACVQEACANPCAGACPNAKAEPYPRPGAQTLPLEPGEADRAGQLMDGDRARWPHAFGQREPGWTAPVAGEAGKSYAEGQADHDEAMRSVEPADREGPGYTEPPFGWDPDADKDGYKVRACDPDVGLSGSESPRTADAALSPGWSPDGGRHGLFALGDRQIIDRPADRLALQEEQAGDDASLRCGAITPAIWEARNKANGRDPQEAARAVGPFAQADREAEA